MSSRLMKMITTDAKGNLVDAVDKLAQEGNSILDNNCAFESLQDKIKDWSAKDVDKIRQELRAQEKELHAERLKFEEEMHKRKLAIEAQERNLDLRGIKLAANEEASSERIKLKKQMLDRVCDEMMADFTARIDASEQQFKLMCKNMKSELTERIGAFKYSLKD